MCVGWSCNDQLRYVLRYTDTPLSFSDILTKENNFCNFKFYPLDEAFLNRVGFVLEKNLLIGEQLFYELSPTEMGIKKIKLVLLSLKMNLFT